MACAIHYDTQSRKLRIKFKISMQSKYRIFIDYNLLAMVVLSAVFWLLMLPAESAEAMDKVQRTFLSSVIDYREHLNPTFPKRPRKSTRYIIVHTSECDLKTTLKIVSQGKQDNFKWVSRGGHTHYVIARDGRTYRILDEKFRANHAGRSMWNGIRNINRVSVGIELVGYHDGRITASQYESIGLLLGILKTASIVVKLSEEKEASRITQSLSILITLTDVNLSAGRLYLPVSEISILSFDSFSGLGISKSLLFFKER